MIDRLQDILPHLEQLPAETHEEVMAYIEVLLEALERDAVEHGRMRQTLPAIPQTEPWSDPVGDWSDLPDTMLDELEQLRYATPPTPPIELL